MDCAHNDVKTETVLTYKIPEGYNNMPDEADMEFYRVGDIESTTKCMTCGEVLCI